MKKLVMLLFVVMVGVFTLALGYVRARSGDLDPTWGDAGETLDAITDDEDWLNAHVLTDSGKYVVAGWAGVPGDFAVVRYLPDGRLDTGFGDGGKVVTAFSDDPTLVDVAWATVARPDGGLYVAGDTCDADYFLCELGIAAYRADGTLDTAFSDDGLATVGSDLGPTYSWPGRAIVQPDGTLVVGGVIFLEEDVDLILARFHPDGTPDEMFGVDGVAMIDLGETENFMQDLMLLPDGKFLVAGVFGAAIDPLSSEQDAGYIARIQADGSVDMTFGGGDGYVSWNNNGQGALAQHSLLTPDNQLLILGYQTAADGADCTLNRFDIDGNPDLSFGTGGQVIIDIGRDDECFEMDFDRVGRIVFGGRDMPVEESAMAMALNAAGRLGPHTAHRLAAPVNRDDEPPGNVIGRYHADGTPDATFGDNGLLRLTLAGGAGLIFNLTVQPDGKTLVSGDTLYEFVTARILGDGPAAQTFLPLVQGGAASGD
ncbi:MAG: hypothetical protein M9896_05060 [Candidatus Promineofilum sp.]|uniref:hypothetical protein n=1 Tax=Promineifilum sp. TaxID=2664178 RepID=UPI0024119D14|nr:hypothetical protein [Promineifilum sp.]